METQERAEARRLIEIFGKELAIKAINEILSAINGMVSEDHGYSADGYYQEVKHYLESF